MSYILDALRKSERQRRLGNIPSLAREARTPPSAHAKYKWLAAGVVLSATLVSAGWLMMQRDPAPAGGPPAERTGAFAALGVEPPAQDPSAANIAIRPPPAGPAAKPVAGAGVALKQPVPALPRAPIAAEQPPAPTAPQAPAEPIAYARLDPEFRAQLPPLSVNAVSFSDDTTRRFVMINEGIYREGQNVAGVTVAHILREGVVLSYRGREFLLTP